jgi:hypothetical protein
MSAASSVSTDSLTLSPRSSGSSRCSRASFAPDDYLISYFDEQIVDSVERGDDEESSRVAKGGFQGIAASWMGLIRNRQPFAAGRRGRTPVRRPLPTLPSLF